MKKTFFIILFFPSLAFSICSIESYQYIYKINKKLDQSIIKKANCSQKMIKKFIKIVENSEGKLSHNILKTHLNENVKLKPKFIEVINFKTLIIKKYAKNGLRVKEISSLLASASLNQDSEKLTKLKCANCNNEGAKNIQVIFGKKKFWINATLSKKYKAFKAITSLNRITPVLSKNDFKPIQTEKKSYSPFFNNMEKIQYYKLNKSLKSGDLLKMNDLTPKKLITYGQRVKLSIQTKTVTLKTIGIAKKSGHYGEFIEIENPKSKKRFLAKVIDFNKAIVEL